MRTRYQKRSGREMGKRYGVPLLLLAVLLAAGAAALLLIDNSHIGPGGPNSARGGAVEINGISCTPKKNLRTYLFMGIDDTAEVSEDYVIGGQCDVLNLLVVDQTHKTYTQLPINRNTMTEVHSYDENGKDLGATRCQISYAHMEGDGGGTLSCENTVKAVSELLYGQKIDGYLALNMEAIPAVNHLAGGVTVTIEDDFSQTDPSLVMGETVTLTDAQAEHFVHDRMNVGDGTNEGRMRRQDAYIESLKSAMTDKVKEDQHFALEVYHTLDQYMVTDLTEKEFGRIANALTECESQGKLEISGTIGEDEFAYATFEPDPDGLADVVIQLFYNRAEE